MKDERIALVGIMVEAVEAVPQINELLHQYSSYILGRMGLPHREKQLSVISIVMEAPADIISALTGKLGMIAGVQTKAIYSKNQGA